MCVQKYGIESPQKSKETLCNFVMVGVICRENSRKISKALWLFFAKIHGKQTKPFCRGN